MAKNFKKIQNQLKKASFQIEKLNQRREEAIQSQNNKGMNKKVETASGEINKLSEVEVENPSTLIKYRQNITVPAMWVPQQGVRSVNLGIIPPEKIVDLDKYIKANITMIDGGDLDSP